MAPARRKKSNDSVGESAIGSDNGCCGQNFTQRAQRRTQRAQRETQNTRDSTVSGEMWGLQKGVIVDLATLLA